ncbi:MAG: DUF1653 domain-containing protein [Hyphomicrobiaceae bacterium]
MISNYFRHVKTGGIYEVVALARVEATLEPVVVYRAVDPLTRLPKFPTPDHTFTRPDEEFRDGRFVQIRFDEEGR